HPPCHCRGRRKPRMKRQKAKGKRQKATLAPAAAPPPVSQPIDAPSSEENLPLISAAIAPDSTAAPAAECVNATPTPATFSDRTAQFLIEHGSLTVATIAGILSVISFVYFFTNGMTNHYGDGIAHLNIARKVVDSPDSSLWQRYLQIGTPWLPLQTVLMLPLVANDGLWRSGA